LIYHLQSFLLYIFSYHLNFKHFSHIIFWELNLPRNLIYSKLKSCIFCVLNLLARFFLKLLNQFWDLIQFWIRRQWWFKFLWKGNIKFLSRILVIFYKKIKCFVFEDQLENFHSKRRLNFIKNPNLIFQERPHISLDIYSCPRDYSNFLHSVWEKEKGLVLLTVFWLHFLLNSKANQTKRLINYLSRRLKGNFFEGKPIFDVTIKKIKKDSRSYPRKND
jgi:hypothetical protein